MSDWDRVRTRFSGLGRGGADTETASPSFRAEVDTRAAGRNTALPPKARVKVRIRAAAKTHSLDSFFV